MAQDIQLQNFWQKVKRRRGILEELTALREEQEMLSSTIKELSMEKQKVQEETEKLEKLGVFSFFYGLIGKKAEKLEEKRETEKNVLEKYEEVSAKLEHLNRNITLKETEYQILDGYEEKFLKLLEEKRKILMDSQIPRKNEVLQLEQKLSRLKVREQIIIELFGQSEVIFAQIKELQDTLHSAERAETMRRFLGTNQLDKAQKQTAELQKNLKEFEIGIETILEGEKVTDSLDMVYQFCNGIFTSYVASNSVMQTALLERIRGAKGSVKLLEKELRGLMEKVLQKQKEIKREKRNVQEIWEEMIISA